MAASRLILAEMSAALRPLHPQVPRIVEMVGEELCAEASLVDEAYYVLEERRTDGAKVPLQALNLVIEACAQLEDLDRAFATWSELEAFGLQPDVGTFNALLHTCVKTREIGSGRRLLARQAEAGVPRDGHSYFLECALLMRSPRDHKQAAGVLDECKAAGVTPTAKHYVTAINYALRAGKKAQATTLLEEMASHKYTVTNAFRERVERGDAGNDKSRRGNQQRGNAGRSR